MVLMVSIARAATVNSDFESGSASNNRCADSRKPSVKVDAIDREGPKEHCLPCQYLLTKLCCIGNDVHTLAQNRTAFTRRGEQKRTF